LSRIEAFVARAVEAAQDRGQFRLVLEPQRLELVGRLALDLFELRFTLRDRRVAMRQLSLLRADHRDKRLWIRRKFSQRIHAAIV